LPNWLGEQLSTVQGRASGAARDNRTDPTGQASEMDDCRPTPFLRAWRFAQIPIPIPEN
jgi:hypothetical protein